MWFYACSSNILLDDHFTAKISDFGFALHLPQVQQNKTMVTAPLIARTEGYFPPEITSGKFSDKSDVYSYGVVRHLLMRNNGIIAML